MFGGIAKTPRVNEIKTRIFHHNISKAVPFTIEVHHSSLGRSGLTTAKIKAKQNNPMRHDAAALTPALDFSIPLDLYFSSI
jgi:hypothetical protein